MYAHIWPYTIRWLYPRLSPFVFVINISRQAWLPHCFVHRPDVTSKQAPGLNFIVRSNRIVTQLIYSLNWSQPSCFLLGEEQGLISVVFSLWSAQSSFMKLWNDVPLMSSVRVQNVSFIHSFIHWWKWSKPLQLIFMLGFSNRIVHNSKCNI